MHEMLKVVLSCEVVQGVSFFCFFFRPKMLGSLTLKMFPIVRNDRGKNSVLKIGMSSHVSILLIIDCWHLFCWVGNIVSHD